MSFHKILFCSLLSISMMSSSAAQGLSEPMTFRHFTPEQGLSFSQVLSITRDARGFMWFGTQNGLNRFDGNNFEVFRRDAADSRSLSDNFIPALHADPDGSLWIGTRGGLNHFDQETGVFVHYRHQPDNSNTIGHDEITAIHRDRQGVLWVGTMGGGLARMNRDGSFTRFRHDAKDISSLSHDEVRAIAEDNRGNLWIGTRMGLNRMDASRDGFTRFFPDPQNPQTSPGHSFIFSLAVDHQDRLWLGSFGGGLDRFDPKTGRFEHFRHEPGNRNSLAADHIWSLLVDGDGTLWAGTLDRGLCRFIEETRSFVTHTHDPDEHQSLSSNKVWSLFHDPGGSLWVGTGDQGLEQFTGKARQFAHFSKNPVNPDDSKGFVVTALAADDEDRVWLGTWKHGLMALENERFTHYPIKAEEKKQLIYVLSILPDDENHLWVGIWHRALARMDRRTGAFEYFYWDLDENQPPSPQDHVAAAIVRSTDNHLWVGSYGSGLLRFDPQTQTFQTFAHDPDNPQSISHNRVFAIHEDSRGDLWVGTIGGGLNRLDGETGQFQRFRHNPHDTGSLSHDRITFIHEDSRQRLWVGTEGGGLERWRPETGDFQHFTIEQGFSTNVINSMQEDTSGLLWLGSNQGAMSFHPDTGEVTSYGRNDGVMNELNAGVSCRTTDGALYFGGTRGFNRFNPDLMFTNEHVPPIVVTGLEILGKPSGQHYFGPQIDLQLTYKDNFIEFRFAALDYHAPQNNQYAVKLEGFNDEWIHLGNRRRVNYTNLPGGSYTLRVKGSNNHGVWNEAGAALKLSVKPPFWMTWWFRLLLWTTAAAIVLGLSSLIYLRRIRREQRARAEIRETKQHLAEGREVERLRIARELHDGPVQDLHALQLHMRLNDARKDQGEEVSKIIRELRNLCGELRPPSLGPFGLEAAFRAHAELVRERHPELELRLDLMKAPENLPEKTVLALFRIYQESINNALAHAGGEKLSILFEWDAERLILEVRDNGRGFHVRESMIELSRQGHYGLLGISERAESIGGRFEIESAPGKGATVRVIAPAPGMMPLPA